MNALILLLGAAFAAGVTVLYLKRRTGGAARIIGDDVFVDLWVTREQVERRETVVIEHPLERGEEIRVKLPEISGVRIALRMADRGVEGRGDLYINVKIKTPYGRV